VNFQFRSGTDLQGVLRLNLRRDASCGQLDDFYGISSMPRQHQESASIATGFMVHASKRGGYIATCLSIAAYEYALNEGIRWSYIDCIPRLKPFFSKLGYMDFLTQALHPEYGFEVYRMRLDLHDHNHLFKVRSPFYASHKRWRSEKIRCQDSDG